MLIQILIFFFILFAISRLILRFKKAELKVSEFFIWLVFWLAAGVAVGVPNITTRLANLLGIGRGADLVFYFALVTLFYLIFRIYVKLEKMERDITKIVRKDALNDYPPSPEDASSDQEDNS